MRILGIDPGTRISAYAIVEKNKNKFTLIHCGAVKTPAKVKDHSIKLGYIYGKLDEVIREFTPEVLSIESAFYGKNAQSLVKLGRVQGVVLALAMQHKLPYKMFAPREIKKAITGYGNASKEQVAMMLQHFINKNIHYETSDVSDAVAIAITYGIYR